MTDAECAEILTEYRKLRLGPELSAAMDHAIGRLRPAPTGFALGPLVIDRGSGGAIAGGAYDGVLMNSRAIDLAAA